jgi:hypothetical protein
MSHRQTLSKISRGEPAQLSQLSSLLSVTISSKLGDGDGDGEKPMAKSRMMNHWHTVVWHTKT